MWHVNCGATYVWGGRAISPYFGWMTGWVIILAYFLGATSIAYPIGPYALSLVSNRWQDSTVAAALIGAIAIVARHRRRLRRHQGDLPAAGPADRDRVRRDHDRRHPRPDRASSAAAPTPRRSTGAGSRGARWAASPGCVNASLIAVYMYSGWDTAILLNEETQDARTNPGQSRDRQRTDRGRPVHRVHVRAGGRRQVRRAAGPRRQRPHLHRGRARQHRAGQADDHDRAVLGGRLDAGLHRGRRSRHLRDGLRQGAAADLRPHAPQVQDAGGRDAGRCRDRVRLHLAVRDRLEHAGGVRLGGEQRRPALRALLCRHRVRRGGLLPASWRCAA